MKNYQNCEKITFLSLLRLGICLDNEGKVVTHVFLGALQVCINIRNLYWPSFMAKMLFLSKNVAKTL